MRLSPIRAADSVASTLLAALLLLSSASPAYAQNDNTETTAAATTTARGGQRTTTADNTDQQTTTSTDDAKTTATAKQTTTTAAATTRGRLTFTSSDESTTTEDVSSTEVTDAPTLTSLSAFHLTGLPTIAGAGIPTQVVPWTGGAAFMQKSSLPEGTVFICVGAILGALAGGVLLWRGLVAWSLHRSVQRAAMASHSPDPKSSLIGGGGARRGNVYSTAAPASSLSLDGTAALNPDRMSNYHGSKNTRLSSAAAGRPTASSLFFSPTAGAGAGINPAANVYSGNLANRSSGYLPAGYYTSASSPGPAGGSNVASVGGAGGASNNGFIPNSIRGGPAAAGYQRASSFGHSPPASPNLPPSRGTDATYGRGSMVGTIGGTPVSAMSGPGPVVGSRPSHGDMYSNTSGSRSDFRLDVPGSQQGRAPSAYLEDLFENHGNGPRERF